MRTENGSVLELWRQDGTGRILDVDMPCAWTQPIPREDSGRIEVYDIAEE